MAAAAASKAVGLVINAANARRRRPSRKAFSFHNETKPRAKATRPQAVAGYASPPPPLRRQTNFYGPKGTSRSNFKSSTNWKTLLKSKLLLWSLMPLPLLHFYSVGVYQVNGCFYKVTNQNSNFLLKILYQYSLIDLFLEAILN